MLMVQCGHLRVELQMPPNVPMCTLTLSSGHKPIGDENARHLGNFWILHGSD